MTRRENGTHFYIVDGGEYRGEANDGVFAYKAGDSFKDCALLRDKPQIMDIGVASDALACFCISHRDFKLIISDRNRKEKLVKDCAIFETMSDEQVAVLVGAFRRVRYPFYPGAPPIVRQAAHASPESSFYLLEKGECVATILQPDGSQPDVKTYQPGGLFGEKALMESRPRAASIMQTTEIVVLQLREEFSSRRGSTTRTRGSSSRTFTAPPPRPRAGSWCAGPAPADGVPGVDGAARRRGGASPRAPDPVRGELRRAVLWPGRARVPLCGVLPGPLNPAGLLVAYTEERHVKPIVSNFDTLLVGSQGAKPFDALADEQRALVLWLLRKTEQQQTTRIISIEGSTFSWSAATTARASSRCHNCVGYVVYT